VLQDLTTAWRFLLKRRTSTAIAVLTLGVTVALSTIAVGAIDQAFWRPADAARGGELVTFYSSRPSAPFFQTLSYPDYVDIRDRVRDRVELAALVRVENTLAGGEWPTRVWGELVTGNYFSVLGTRPFAGRLLSPDDDRVAGAQPVIVLGHEFWRRQFNGDQAMIGRLVKFGGHDFTVVGIAPQGFQGPAWPSHFWIPLAMTRHVMGVDVLPRSDAPILQTVGRMTPGVAPGPIEAQVASVATFASKAGWQLKVFPATYLRFWPAYRSTVGQFLGVFAGLAACVLLIACANLAGLLIARAGERQRELAIRQALGATRRQLLRRLVAEGVILGVTGGALGLLLAAWAAALVNTVPLPVPVRLSVTFDWRLAAICVVLSLAASVVFTALSAFKGLHANLQRVLVGSAGTLAPRAGVHRVLVVAQVALGCLMLTVGGLLVRSAWHVEQVDVGFSAERGVLGRVALVDERYTGAAGDSFYQQLQDNLAARPDVESVALGWHAPVSSMRTTARFTTSRSPDVLQSRYNVVSPDYFRTLGVRVLAGREFDSRDRREAEAVAIVNDVLAARFEGDAIDQTLQLVNEPQPRRIVGVVRELKYNGITEPSQPYVYLPLAQAFRRDMFVHLRTRAAGAETLRTELRRLDSDVALSDVRTLSEQLDAARATPRVTATMATVAAAIAVLLALVGVYGVLMTSVEQRQRELAIRSALGATPSAIVRGVVREGLTMTLAGLLLGMLASVQAGRLLTSLLYGVEPRDAVVMAVVPLIVLLASAIAWFTPARRAGAVDPVAVFKSQ
jgi:predicted permease